MKKLLGLFNNELVLTIALLVAWLFTISAVLLGFTGLWLSTATFAGAALYYASRFFTSKAKADNFVFFLLCQFLLITYFAAIYRAVGLIQTSTGEQIIPDLTTAFYFSVVTWTTLGYGDYVPPHDLKLFAVSQAYLGYIFLGLLVGKVLFMLQSKVQS